jgi:hypothetical protein
MRQVPKGDAGSAPAIRVVTGTDSVSCGNDEILAGFVCASGATDGAKCATQRRVRELQQSDNFTLTVAAPRFFD